MEPVSKRRKVEDFTQAIVSDELAVTIGTLSGMPDVTGLTLRRVYEEYRRACGTTFNYSHAMHAWWDRRIEMFRVMLCGINDEVGLDIPTLLKSVFRHCPQLVDTFLDVYETGYLKTTVDMAEVYSDPNNAYNFQVFNPEIFVRLVRRGDIVMTCELFLNAVEQSLKTPLPEYDQASELFGDVLEHDMTVYTMETTRRFYMARQCVRSIVVENNDNGKPLSEILQEAVAYRHVDNKYLYQRACNVQTAYSDLIARNIRYRDGVLLALRAVTDLLPVLCVVVNSYLF